MPGDKSISHRALILGAIAWGETNIAGFLPGEDCLATARCLGQLGVDVNIHGNTARITGRGLRSMRPPQGVLDVGNSGTTLRLLTGLLAGQRFDSVLDGDESIRRRPMDRVVMPLTQMGAKIEGNFAPIHIMGVQLQGIHYKMPINSAQVKSAIMLAGLYAKGETRIEEPGYGLTRNHTEIMMEYMGGRNLQGREIIVPGDFSSAAFFIVAGVLMAEDGLTIENVGVNPTRTGLLDALGRMGAHIEVKNHRVVCGEEVGDIFVKKSVLKGVVVAGDVVPRMIDEVPIFAVAALFAEGATIIQDAGELAVKESNRIAAMTGELGKMGAKIEARQDGMIIHGGHPLYGAAVDSHKDHRVAMALAVAALMARGHSVIQDAGCVGVSFPGFFGVLEGLG